VNWVSKNYRCKSCTKEYQKQYRIINSNWDKLNYESKNNFKSLCCSILPNKFKYSKKSLRILKEISEDYLCRIFQLANIFKKYRNKKTLTVDDLSLAQYFIRN
jgi:histone H3/H4